MTPTTLTIEEVDVFDDRALGAWLDTVNAVDRNERGDASTPWTFAELAVVSREPSKSWETIRLTGSVDGRRYDLELPVQPFATPDELQVNLEVVGATPVADGEATVEGTTVHWSTTRDEPRSLSVAAARD